MGTYIVGWDPSKPPRRPRERITRRRVRPLNRFLGESEVASKTLSPLQALELAACVPTVLPNTLLIWFLLRSAEGYWWDRRTAEPSRSHIKFQLRMLAHLVWRIRNRPELLRESKKELVDFVYSIDYLTERLLLNGIEQTRPDLGPAIYQLYSPGGIGLSAVYQGARWTASVAGMDDVIIK